MEVENGQWTEPTGLPVHGIWMWSEPFFIQHVRYLIIIIEARSKYPVLCSGVKG